MTNSEMIRLDLELTSALQNLLCAEETLDIERLSEEYVDLRETRNHLTVAIVCLKNRLLEKHNINPIGKQTA